MNRSFFFALVLAVTSPLWAADSPLPEGTIDSQNFEYDQRAGVLHYSGEVRLRYPGALDLDCADLEIRLQTGGSKLDQIVARTNVVLTIVQAPSTNSATQLIKSSATNHAYAAMAVFNGTNNTVTLSGSPEFGQPWVEAAEGSFKADVIIYDRAKDKFIGDGRFRMRVKLDALPKTNPLAPSAEKKPLN